MNNEMQKQEPEIIVMRAPTGERHSQATNTAWSPWAMFGVIVAAIVVGNIVWWWGVAIYAEHKLGQAQEALAQEAKAKKKKTPVLLGKTITQKNNAKKNKDNRTLF